MTTILLQSKDGKDGHNFENRMRDTIEIEPNSELQFNWAQFTKNITLNQTGNVSLYVSDAYPTTIPSDGTSNTQYINATIPVGNYTLENLKDKILIEMEKEITKTRFYSYHTAAEFTVENDDLKVVSDYYNGLGVGMNTITIGENSDYMTEDIDNSLNTIFGDNTGSLFGGNFYLPDNIGSNVGYKSYCISEQYYNHYNPAIKLNLDDNDDILDKELTRSILFSSSSSPDNTPTGKVSIGLWSKLYGTYSKSEGFWPGSTGGISSSNAGYNNPALWDIANGTQMKEGDINFTSGVLMSWCTIEIDYNEKYIYVYAPNSILSQAYDRQDFSLADVNGGMRRVAMRSIEGYQNNIKGHFYIQKNIELDDAYEVVVKIYDDDHYQSETIVEGLDISFNPNYFDTGTNAGLTTRNTTIERNMQIPFNVILASDSDELGFENIKIWTAPKNELITNQLDESLTTSDSNPFSIIKQCSFTLSDNLQRIFNPSNDYLNPNFFIDYKSPNKRSYVENYCISKLLLSDSFLLSDYTIYIRLPVEGYKNKTTNNSQGGYKKQILASCPEVFNDKLNSNSISEFNKSYVADFVYTYEPFVKTIVKLKNKYKININDIKIEIRNMKDDTIPYDLKATSLQLTLHEP